MHTHIDILGLANPPTVKFLLHGSIQDAVRDPGACEAAVNLSPIVLDLFYDVTYILAKDSSKIIRVLCLGIFTFMAFGI